MLYYTFVVRVLQCKNILLVCSTVSVYIRHMLIFIYVYNKYIYLYTYINNQHSNMLIFVYVCCFYLHSLSAVASSFASIACKLAEKRTERWWEGCRGRHTINLCRRRILHQREQLCELKTLLSTQYS